MQNLTLKDLLTGQRSKYFANGTVVNFDSERSSRRWSWAATEPGRREADRRIGDRARSCERRVETLVQRARRAGLIVIDPNIEDWKSPYRRPQDICRGPVVGDCRHCTSAWQKRGLAGGDIGDRNRLGTRVSVD